MTKIVIRFGLFAAIGVLLASVLSSFAARYSRDYLQSRFRIGQLLQRAESLEVLVLGNSHTLAIDFNVLNVSAYNLAQGGNDLFEIEYQVKSLIPSLPKVHTVLCSMSYFMFNFDNGAFPQGQAHFTEIEYQKFIEQYPDISAILRPFKGENPYGIWIDIQKFSNAQKELLGDAYQEMNRKYSIDRMEIRREYYAAIPSLRFIRGDLEELLISKLSPIIRKDHWKEIFSAIVFAQTYRNNQSTDWYTYLEVDEYGQGMSELFFTHKPREELIRFTREHRVPRHLYLQALMTKHRQSLSDKAYDSLVSTIEFLQERDIRIVFFTPPYFHTYTELFDRETIELMKHRMQLLKNRFGVEYYDDSENPNFIFDHTLFFDSDHMNKDGAKLFSQELKRKLSSQLISAH